MSSKDSPLLSSSLFIRLSRDSDPHLISYARDMMMQFGNVKQEGGKSLDCDLFRDSFFSTFEACRCDSLISSCCCRSCRRSGLWVVFSTKRRRVQQNMLVQLLLPTIFLRWACSSVCDMRCLMLDEMVRYKHENETDAVSQRNSDASMTSTLSKIIWRLDASAFVLSTSSFSRLYRSFIIKC